MQKRVLIIAGVSVLVLAVGGVLFFLSNSQKPTAALVQQEAKKEVSPSVTLKSYTDPSGFSFNYPDNLSLLKNETDNSTYADLELSTKDVSGKINIKIVDTKVKTLTDWSTSYKKDSSTSKETKLGNLQALELKTKENIHLGALDQGILFALDVTPSENEGYWSRVYNSIVNSFNFSSPAQSTSNTSSGASSEEQVSFEGEEVVE